MAVKKFYSMEIEFFGGVGGGGWAEEVRSSLCDV